MIKKKILYLCPEVPYPQETGGQVAFNNHLRSLAKHFIVDAIFLDVEGEKKHIPKDLAYSINSYKIFNRRFRRGSGVIGLLAAAYLFIRYKFPRAYSVRINKEAKRHISQIIESYEAVICDHFTAFAFLEQNVDIKKIYIAHNVEANVLRDQYKAENNYIKKLVYYIEYYRTKILENNIIRQSDKIVTISLSDLEFFNEIKGQAMLYNIAEVLPMNPERWRYNNDKVITFLGGTNYFPNYDAVKWIVEKLHPALKVKERITIQIIGKTSNLLKENPFYLEYADIQFLGFVPDIDLDRILLKSSVFISPIVYGSGIKIKVLKAISMGIPVFCTQESFFGIEYLENQQQLVFNREDVKDTVNKLIALLDNKEELEELSAFITDQSLKQHRSTEILWQTIIA